MNISEKIKKIRLDKGLTQGQVAKLLGSDYVQQDIHRYENSKRGVPAEYLADFCKSLNIDIGSLTSNGVTTQNISNDSFDVNQELIECKTEARIYKELHLEHLETERMFIQKVEAILIDLSHKLQINNEGKDEMRKIRKKIPDDAPH